MHISAFPRDGVRPRVGELISYEVDMRKDGKQQAVHIMRPDMAHRPQRPRTTARGIRRQSPLPLASLGGTLLFAAMLAYADFSLRHAVPPAPSQPTALAAPSAASTQLFSCDGRTRCSQMTSCAEARFFLDHCPGTLMDGNHDGVPCQSQWCGASRGNWP